MLPTRLLRYDLRDDEVVPRFLSPADHPWLRALLDAAAALAGRPRRALRARLREPLAGDPHPDRLAMAAHVVDALCQGRTRPPVPPRKARAAVFGLAARGGARADVLAAAATALGATAAQVEASLLVDLADEAPLGPPPPDLDPGALAQRVNLALVQGLLARATRVTVRALGGARAVVRLAKLQGLICTVRRDGEGVVLEASGPLALFRRTRVYGRALGALVLPVGWCDRFELTAPCALPEGERVLRLTPRAPLLRGEAPRRFDSAVEAALARDLARLAPDWDVVREPEPVAVGDGLIFPDLALVHRLDPGRRALIEVVGFWTPDYLARKLEALRRAGLPGLILCVDAARACGPDDLPPGARVVRYRRRVPAAEVLALALEAAT
ncbi:MAG: DUF790 family protein [Planctomycetes bacterium]|nr:DUF790 family protein [Planctomycetota bacterium]